MFSWNETCRLKSDLPFKEMRKIVCREFDEIGDCEADYREKINVSARQFSSFAYDAKISFHLEDRSAGSYRIDVKYEVAPNAMIVLCFLFWPLLLVVFFMGQSAKQRMEREINRVLDDLEVRFDGGHRAAE